MADSVKSVVPRRWRGIGSMFKLNFQSCVPATAQWKLFTALVHTSSRFRRSSYRSKHRRCRIRRREHRCRRERIAADLIAVSPGEGFALVAAHPDARPQRRQNRLPMAGSSASAWRKLRALLSFRWLHSPGVVAPTGPVVASAGRALPAPGWVAGASVATGAWPTANATTRHTGVAQ